MLTLLAIISLFSFVKATECVNNSCDAGQYCSTTQCECNGSIIYSWNTCGTPCTFDGWAYSCNAGNYCPVAQWCECNGGPIALWVVCEGTMPPAGSCSYLWNILNNWQSMQVWQSGTVNFWWSCTQWSVTCSNGVMIGNLNYSYTSCIVMPPPSSQCTLPRWGTINSGASIVAYQTASLSCGGTCVSQTRTCVNGILSWSYSAQSCSVGSCGGGWGWGGGWSYYTSTCIITDLMCVNSNYQKKPGVSCQWGKLNTSCTQWTSTLPVGSIVGSHYSTELNNAYLWAYAQGITTKNTIQKATMNDRLIRSHMAKMISTFAIKLGWLTPNTKTPCNFSDINTQSTEMKVYIKLSCQLGLMGIGTTKFNPADEITRAQFGTILSRLIWRTKYDGGSPYYTLHLNALKRAEIMTQISTPTMKELRGYVMLMLQRTYNDGFLNK